LNMKPKILFVDDDPNILSGFNRQLHTRFDVDTALGGEEGLVALNSRGPYAVIVADMRMPGMDGIQLLTRVKESAPDTVRIMLTGQSDAQTAIEAINQGNIFRFLTKPCAHSLLVSVLNDSVRQYRLIMAEKELLEKTLKSSIGVLTDLLSIVNPSAFGRASRVRCLVRDLGAVLKVDEPWQMEVGAMLSQVGCVTVPEETLAKVYHGEVLSPEEMQMFQAHPGIGRDLIGSIPRLETIAEITAYQEKHFNGAGMPEDDRMGNQIPLGARILKIALDFDTLTSAGRSCAEAYSIMRTREGWYDPSILEALTHIVDLKSTQEIAFVNVEDLSTNMTIADDVKTPSGMLLISKGQEATPSIRMRLLNYKRMRGIREPIKVVIANTGNKEGFDESSERPRDKSLAEC
jgi:response regulator RpfG family c-di-GMP phosphodiesterase